MKPAPFTLNPAVAASLGFAAAVAILLPFALGWIWRRRTGASWRVFWCGALVFFVSQVVLRIPWQIPLTTAMAKRTMGFGPLWTGFLLFSSLTAGIFEETGRWIGYKILLRKERSPRIGVMFGLGHGGIESVLLVGLSLAGLLVAAVLASKGLLPPDPKIDMVKSQISALTPLTPLAAAVERMSAIATHVGLSLVVLQVFARGRLYWLFVSIFLHFAVNAVAVLTLPRLGAWPTEAAVAVFAAGVLTLGAWLARGKRIQTPAAPAVEYVKPSEQ